MHLGNVSDRDSARVPRTEACPTQPHITSISPDITSLLDDMDRRSEVVSNRHVEYVNTYIVTRRVPADLYRALTTYIFLWLVIGLPRGAIAIGHLTSAPPNKTSLLEDMYG